MTDQLKHSRAPSTIRKYDSYFKGFEVFCKEHSFIAKPANAIHVGMYISRLITEKKSDKVISAAFYAIKWEHNINDMNDPTENKIVLNLVEAGKRLNSTPTTKIDVVNTQDLINLCKLFPETSDVMHLRDLAMIMLCYAGFLRFNEASELRCNDVIFKENHVVLKIRHSKTDVYRSGDEVLIAKGDTIACPYNILERYTNAACIDLKSDQYLFKPVRRTKGQCTLQSKNKQLCYTRARECIVGKLKLVAPTLSLGTHSLRASGASMAANADGVSDRCLKRHGRWKSDSSKDRYIADSTDRKLLITRKLKL